MLLKLPIPVESEPSIQAVARSVGAADQNESTPANERTSESKSPLGPGPIRGPAGEYLPATYNLPEIPVEKKNGTIEIVKIIREDR